MSFDPLAFLVKSGARAPFELIDGVLPGVTEWEGTLDYDAAAETTIIDFKQPQTHCKDKAATEIFPFSAANPNVNMLFDRIRVSLMEESASEHQDPEDLVDALDGIHLKIQFGQTTKYYDIKGAGLSLTKIASGGDSTTGVAAVHYFNKAAEWHQLRESRLVNLESVKTCALVADATAAGSVLSADADVKCEVFGGLWDAGIYGAGDAPTLAVCSDRGAATMGAAASFRQEAFARTFVPQK